MKPWVLYILECSDKTLYTGITNDLDRRIKAHNEGNGAKYTRGRGPVLLRYVEKCDSHGSALRRELEIKKMSRAEKISLCNHGNIEEFC